MKQVPTRTTYVLAYHTLIPVSTISLIMHTRLLHNWLGAYIHYKPGRTVIGKHLHIPNRDRTHNRLCDSRVSYYLLDQPLEAPDINVWYIINCKLSSNSVAKSVSCTLGTVQRDPRHLQSFSTNSYYNCLCVPKGRRGSTEWASTSCRKSSPWSIK